MKKITLLCLILACGLISCTASRKGGSLVRKIESAHQKQLFLEKKAIRFDLVLTFGGRERFNGKLTLSSDSRYGVLEYKDGGKVYYLDDKVYFSPEMVATKGIRFGAYTWAYFFLFPYKLSDAGTRWESFEGETLGKKTYDTKKLNFDAGTGDSPDDWYIVYADPESHIIEVAAYIVTASKSRTEAEEDPHAIEYKEYTTVEGVPFAQKWIFWAWREKEGLTKELGSADLKNIEFPVLPSDYFTPPKEFKEM